MTTIERTVQGDEGEMDLIAAWLLLWRYRYLVLLCSALCAALAIVIALSLTPVFRASVVVTEVQDSRMGAISGLTSQLGGLASLAGVNLGGAGGSNREARAVLESRHLVEEFVRRNDLARVLLPKSKQPPSLWLAVERFRESALQIHDDKLKGTITISVDWPDPVVATHWANEFVALANESVRARAIEESTRSISYLNEQLPKTDVVEVRRAMFGLLENETKTLMLAHARTEYAVTVVDPAVVPEHRISPKRTLMVIVGGALGLFIGAALAFLLNAVKRYRDASRRSAQTS